MDRKVLVEIKRFIQRQILAHFAYEEERIFPMLLHGHPVAETFGLVEGLLHDHTRLVKEAKRLIKWLETDKLDAAKQKSLRRAFQEFGRHLEQHAARENEWFPSLL